MVHCKKLSRFYKELRALERVWIASNESKTLQDKIGRVHRIRCLDVNELGYTDNVSFRPRLWYQPGELEYKGRHYWVGPKLMNLPDSGKKTEITDWNNPRFQEKSLQIEEFQITQDHSCRTLQREDQRLLYETDVLPRLEE